ncbi:hypothetical protein LQ330_14145 [Stenotrophomonas maltophilia]|nr:hypothetical protein LQ332_19245 [Stenotrophomonas maltophilia]UGB48174.1 hypothetical protein LQ330_14145 [Stenotrophomonas maltophilia]
MERERHEPTFSAPDLHDVRFRGGRNRTTRQTEPTSPWVYIGVSAALLVAIAMGLIEWNARRQAAAITRELMRPATPEEQAMLDRQTAEWQRKLEAETAAEMAQVRRTIQLDRVVPVPHREPLKTGERCIDGRRFKRLAGGGWRDLPNSPC